MLATTENNKTTANNVWDSKTQTFHGGQEHRFINNFVEDFSVTTNYLGTPRKALEAAKEAVRFFFFILFSCGKMSNLK